MLEKIKALLNRYYEIISYLFWGGCTTVVSWGTYSVFSLLSGNVFLSNALSWICAVLFAYVTNKLWVFRSKSWKKEVVVKEFSMFMSSRILTGILEIVLVPLFVRIGLTQTVFGIKGSVSKIIVSFLVIILNYVFSKLFVFKKENTKETV